MTAFVDQDRGPGHHVRERPHPVDVNRARHRRRKRRNRAGVDAAPERPDEPAVLRNLEDHAIAGADAGFSQPSRSRHRLRVEPAIRDEDVPPILEEGDPLFVSSALSRSTSLMVRIVFIGTSFGCRRHAGAGRTGPAWRDPEDVSEGLKG